eukprot:4820693-Amphidinium_carterae.1
MVRRYSWGLSWKRAFQAAREDIVTMPLMGGQNSCAVEPISCNTKLVGIVAPFVFRLSLLAVNVFARVLTIMTALHGLF